MKLFILVGLFSFSALAGSSLQITVPYGTYINNEAGPQLQIYYPDRVPASNVQIIPPVPEPTVQSAPVEYRPQDYWHQPSSAQEYWAR